MADTFAPVTQIQDEWINVYSFIGVEVGIPLVLQNTGTRTLLLYISADQPAANAQGRHIYPLSIENLNIGNNGLWVKNSPKSAGFSRLQADPVGGIDDLVISKNLFPDALQVQLASTLVAADETIFVSLTNNTTASITLEQIVNAGASSNGVSEGTSIVAWDMYFNPDFTGATSTPANSNAYANSYDGKFVNITGTGIILNSIQDFNPIINSDVLSLVGGQVTFFQSTQGLTSESFNKSLIFLRPFTLAIGDSIVLSFNNQALIDGGTDVVATGLFSGRFLTLSGSVEVAPDNLTYEGDNLTYDNDQLTYGA